MCDTPPALQGTLLVFIGVGLPTACFIASYGVEYFLAALEGGVVVGGIAALLFWLSQNNWSLFGAAIGGAWDTIKSAACGVWKVL